MISCQFGHVCLQEISQLRHNIRPQLSNVDMFVFVKCKNKIDGRVQTNLQSSEEAKLGKFYGKKVWSKNYIRG